jgi:hypothetical protein
MANGVPVLQPTWIPRAKACVIDRRRLRGSARGAVVVQQGEPGGDQPFENAAASADGLCHVGFLGSVGGWLHAEQQGRSLNSRRESQPPSVAPQLVQWRSSGRSVGLVTSRLSVAAWVASTRAVVAGRRSVRRGCRGWVRKQRTPREWTRPTCSTWSVVSRADRITGRAPPGRRPSRATSRVGLSRPDTTAR